MRGLDAKRAKEFRLGGANCIVCGRLADALIPDVGIRHGVELCSLPPTPPVEGVRTPRSAVRAPSRNVSRERKRRVM
jgi:hypothetical protein